MTLRIGFVTAVTPDKWARTWRERERESLELVPLTDSEQWTAIETGEVEMAFVRLPLGLPDLHAIRLYDEIPVVVLAREHLLTVLDEVGLEDLREEQVAYAPHWDWRPPVSQKPWPPMGAADGIEVAASGSAVAIVPASVARLHQRRDAMTRPVSGLEPTTVALVWLRANDTERLQRFVGAVRGRRANSSR